MVVLTRRQLLRGIALGAATTALRVLPARAAVAHPALHARLAQIEARTGGRLGVAAWDTHSGWRDGYRAQQRFPLCSTWKLLAVAAILQRAETGHADLTRRIHFTVRDLVTYSPVTREHAGASGMTLRELCAAALVWSDNSAGNLLLDALGGPPAITRFARALGDDVTRLDRNEPGLNAATPGDARDTTAPQAMLGDLHALLLGDVLGPSARAQLLAWMRASTTGAQLLRAGFPATWQAGDKSGAGGHGTRNDVAMLTPPGRAPLLVATYLTSATVPMPQRDAALAAVGHALWQTVTGTDIG